MHESELIKTRPVGARIPRPLYIRFKSQVVALDLKIQDVIATMIRLFLEDLEFRSRVLKELNKG